MAQIFDVCIRGAGIAGRTLALLLARERLRVALVAPPKPPPVDVRAYALNRAAREVLQSVRGWPQAQHATAVQHMQVFADQGAMVQFDAHAQGSEALAWIVDVPALHARLADAVEFQSAIDLVQEPVAAPLTVICEGRSSQTRQELGVEFDSTAYRQQAIATRLDCALPHGQIARQWFGNDGSILAFLPLNGEAGNSVAVVWSVPDSQVQTWLQADDETFTQHLYQASQGALGELHMSSARAHWPLQQAQAKRWCGHWPGDADRAWVLAGDAAHNVHPLAGQGLNLGLADVQALALALAQRQGWRALSDLRPLRSYERQRKAALLPMALTMDGLQQLFTRPEGAAQALRNWGMQGFERSGPLKTWVARQAMGR